MVGTSSTGRRERAPTAFPRYNSTSLTRAIADHRRRRRTVRDQINREHANDREDGLHVAANLAHLRRRLSGKKTLVVGADKLIADRDIFLEIQRSLSAGDNVRLTGRRGPSVVRRRHPVHVNQWAKINGLDAKRRKAGDWEKTIWVPPWKQTGPRLKALAWCMAMWELRVKTFSLHLTPEVIAAAHRHPRGFAFHIQQRMRRRLRHEFSKLGLPAPDFFFVVEATAGIPEHVHGVVEIPACQAAAGRVRDAIREGLLAAAGFSGSRLTGTELRFLDMYFAPGWARYVLKWLAQSSQALDGSLVGANNTLRSRGQHWYRDARDNAGVISRINDLMTERYDAAA